MNVPLRPRRDDHSGQRVVTLLTDYGLTDVYVGVLHGVIARIAPGATVIDISHEVPAGDILSGALALADALPFMPVGVHVAVIDPGVGSPRRAVALRCGDGRILVGPDSGLLGPAASLAGGIVEAVEISDSPWRLDPVSSTFHGRDVFVPVAAALANGQPLAGAGTALAGDELIELEWPRPEVTDGSLVATVTAVDRFGNLALLALPDDAQSAGLQPGGVVTVESPNRMLVARYGATFSDVGPGRLVLIEDSTGRLALAVNGGSASDALGVVSRTQLKLSR